MNQPSSLMTDWESRSTDAPDIDAHLPAVGENTSSLHGYYALARDISASLLGNEV